MKKMEDNLPPATEEEPKAEEPKVTLGDIINTDEEEESPPPKAKEEPAATEEVAPPATEEEEVYTPADKDNRQYAYTDLDTELSHIATQRSRTINRIMGDIREHEPDAPRHLLEAIEDDLTDGILGPDGKRVPFTLEALEQMRTSRSAVTTASGLVRQMQLSGKLKVKSAMPEQERAPKTPAKEQDSKPTLTEGGSKLAQRIAEKNGLDVEVFK